MSVFYNFLDRAQEHSCTGKSNELIVVTRRGKTTDTKVMNNVRTAMLKDNTVLTNGDLVKNLSTFEEFLVVGLQKSTSGAVQAQLHKVNCTVDIVRLTQVFSNGTPTGKYTETPLYTNIGASYVDVTAQMKLYDSGLLPTSTRKFILPKLEGIKILDRIKFGTEVCQVDDVNLTQNESLLTIQTSIDKRKA
jgi:hypothetical protein